MPETDNSMIWNFRLLSHNSLDGFGGIGEGIPVGRGGERLELDSVHRQSARRDDQGVALSEDQVVAHTAA